MGISSLGQADQQPIYQRTKRSEFIILSSSFITSQHYLTVFFVYSFASKRVDWVMHLFAQVKKNKRGEVATSDTQRTGAHVAVLLLLLLAAFSVRPLSCLNSIILPLPLLGQCCPPFALYTWRADNWPVGAAAAAAFFLVVGFWSTKYLLNFVNLRNGHRFP